MGMLVNLKARHEARRCLRMLEEQMDSLLERFAEVRERADLTMEEREALFMDNLKPWTELMSKFTNLMIMISMHSIFNNDQKMGEIRSACSDDLRRLCDAQTLAMNSLRNAA